MYFLVSLLPVGILIFVRRSVFLRVKKHRDFLFVSFRSLSEPGESYPLIKKIFVFVYRWTYTRVCRYINTRTNEREKVEFFEGINKRQKCVDRYARDIKWKREWIYRVKWIGNIMYVHKGMGKIFTLFVLLFI